MTEQDIADKLIEAKEAYYLGDPIMSDSEFDDLEDELREMNPNHSYFKKVGMQLAGKKVKHKVRMRSMQKCNTFEALQSWEKNSLGGQRGWYIVEDKIDGLSGSLHYKNGSLILAVTRGNGEEGQDVTDNAVLIPNIPKKIDFQNEIEIRGEFVLKKDTKLETNGKPLRNLAAGLINRKGDDKEDCKYLSFIAYGIIGQSYKTVDEVLVHLLELGFESFSGTVVCSDIKEVQGVYQNYIDELREHLPYEIDGLIVQPNDIAVHEDLEDGNTHHPVWAVAYKMPNETRETKIIDVDWQVSKNGYLIPVANFEAVIIGGAVIRRASLHNAKQVVNMQLCMDDRILVARANDVIPKVEENLEQSKYKKM